MASYRKYLLNFKYACRLQKPLLIIRLIYTYLSIIFLRRKPLRYIDLAIGFACNLKCEHCFATALKRNGRRKLTPKEYKGIVKQAMKLGAVNFSFQGGEPLLYPQLIEFIKNTYPKQNLISVTTNATLIDEKTILVLKDVGVDILTISLDSAIPQEHDKFRGVPGSYEKTLNTIELALKHGLQITLGAVASHQNIKQNGLIELIELAHHLNIIIFLALAVPLGEWKRNEDIVLTEEDRKYLVALLHKYPLLRTDFDANFVNWGCGAVKEILYLTPYGDVLGCPFLHISLGNVFEESLQTIRSRALKQPAFDHYHHLCLAAEDREYMKIMSGEFYIQDNKIRKLSDIHM